ncbi:hypothetical protein ILUMI_06962, partial [Ignelater luminosus]
WTQLSLPIKLGGLGIRKVTDIALPAFVALTFGVHNLVNLICPSLDKATVHFEEEAKEIWKELNRLSIPTIPSYQRNWDIIKTQLIIDNTFNFDSLAETARLRALEHSEFGTYLQAIETLIDNNSFRVCDALRIDSPVCRPYNCICGTPVGVNGMHGLHLETFSPLSKEAQDLVHMIGTNLNQISGDSRSK